MDSIDLTFERRVRWAYERGRLQNALLGAAPLGLVVLVALLFSHRPLPTLALGLAAITGSAWMLWYGRSPQRAVLPGVLAGLIPLTLALVAGRVSACGAGGCSSLCVPACAVGGVAAGLLVASAGRRRGLGLTFFAPAAALALSVGAMGCACVGGGGLVGLGLGFFAAMAARRWLLLSALALACGSVACEQSAPAKEREPEAALTQTSAALTRVDDPSLVCMVNDRFMNEPQIPIEVEGRVYFGCCEMCKGKLGKDASSRRARDPETHAEVDKATAVLGKTQSGKILYFESERSFEAHLARSAQ